MRGECRGAKGGQTGKGGGGRGECRGQKEGRQARVGAGGGSEKGHTPYACRT